MENELEEDRQQLETLLTNGASSAEVKALVSQIKLKEGVGWNCNVILTS